jgi:group II intron reverse transcriptase/maturase
MRTAETILNIIYDRGQKKQVIDQLYRQLYNQDLYIRAYGRIASNRGATTKGVDQETVDGMSLRKIEDIIVKVREERYRWSPVRRKSIPKANGKTRLLGIPCWSDKLLQEVIRSVLDSYYEPQFSTTSHGFRAGRGCHTALEQIKYNWHGTKWFIEGDIKGCFDNIDHEILLSILREKITDNRFLRMIYNLLQAGYLKDWKYIPTLSGTPQGGIISPLLANIYMDKLDQFVEMELIPRFTEGKKRALNPEYNWLSNQAYYSRIKGDVERAKVLEKQRRSVPSNNSYDPNYRRLRYVRYADDFLLGFIGSKEEALQIKDECQR